MNTSYCSDATLENAIVIMRHGVLDENLDWIPAPEDSAETTARHAKTSLVASGIGALFSGAVSVLAALNGTSPSPF